MIRYLLCLCLAAMFVLAGCSSAPGPEKAASSTTGDPLTGTWSGDWGPSPSDRNTVIVELKWDGARLMGTVNPGPNAVTLGNASFDPATRIVKMEADAQSREGTVHFMIEGKVEGNTMAGTWNHDNRQGDFKITKS